MPDMSNETLLGDLEIALPLFLSRPDATLPAALRPPPLPIAYRMRSAGFRVLRSGRGALGLSVIAGAAGLACLALPAVPRVAQYVDAKPALVEAPRPMRSRLSQALAMVAELEARLAFGVSFGDHLDSADAIRAVPENAASALAAAMASGREGDASSDAPQGTAGDQEDPVALMVLRDLPANAILREGAGAGDGTWAVAAASMDALTGALGEGFDSPVAVDIEMVSQAGVTLRTMHVTLQKDAAAAVAEAAPGEAMLSTGSITSDGPDTSAQSQEVQKEKPAKRRQVRRRAISKGDVALDEKRPRRGVRSAGDNSRAQIARARAMAVGAQNGDEEDKPGFFAKFVGWFKGSSSSEAEPAESASTPAPATPQQTVSGTDDSSFSQFGMFQSK